MSGKIKTISSDLIPEKPLLMPDPTLWYMDYMCSKQNSILKNIKILEQFIEDKEYLKALEKVKKIIN